VFIGVAALLVVLAVAVAGVLAWSGAGAGAGEGSGGGGGTPDVASAPSEPGPSRDTGSPSFGDATGVDKETGSSPGLAAPGPAQGVPVGGVQRSLVRSAQLTVEVEDATAVARQVRVAVAAAGGLVTEEQSSDGGSFLVLRVPADALDRLTDDIGALGRRVTNRSSQVVDATEEVVDLDARVASQQASVTRVRALLAQATSIGDVVAIESELSRREAELDSLTARLTALSDQVEFSTLTVDLRGLSNPVPPEVPAAPGFLDGLGAGWAGLLVVGSAIAAVVGFVLPFVPVVAVLIGIIWLARRIRRAPATAGGRSGPGTEGES